MGCRGLTGWFLLLGISNDVVVVSDDDDVVDDLVMVDVDVDEADDGNDDVDDEVVVDVDVVDKFGKVPPPHHLHFFEKNQGNM